MTDQELITDAMFTFQRYGVLEKIVKIQVSRYTTTHQIVFGLSTNDEGDRSERWSVVYDRRTSTRVAVDHWTQDSGWEDIYPKEPE